MAAFDVLLLRPSVICVAGGVSGGGGVAEKSLYGSVGAQNAPLLRNEITYNGNGVPAARTSELKPKTQSCGFSFRFVCV